MEADPWGLAYKVVTKKIGGARPGVEAMGREAEIAERLFPAAEVLDWNETPIWAGEEPEPEPFAMDELNRAAARLLSGKAPGPDGIFNEILSVVARINPVPLLRAVNVCLKHRTFLSMEGGEGDLPIQGASKIYLRA